MSEHIERQALLDKIPRVKDSKGTFMSLADFVNLVQSIPATDVASVVHGSWDGTADPNCGARMEVGDCNV